MIKFISMLLLTTACATTPPPPTTDLEAKIAAATKNTYANTANNAILVCNLTANICVTGVLVQLTGEQVSFNGSAKEAIQACLVPIQGCVAQAVANYLAKYPEEAKK